MPSSRFATTARSAAPAADVADASPITDARLRQAHDYWRRKAAGRAMPRRADIDPTEIPKLLPDVMLVDVLPQRRYRYRLIGTENTQAHGINATGRYLDEVLPGPEYKSHVIGLYDECVRSRRALYSECLFMSPLRARPERHTKVLFMPLGRRWRDRQHGVRHAGLLLYRPDDARAAFHRRAALLKSRTSSCDAPRRPVATSAVFDRGDASPPPRPAPIEGAGVDTNGSADRNPPP